MLVLLVFTNSEEMHEDYVQGFRQGFQFEGKGVEPKLGGCN